RGRPRRGRPDADRGVLRRGTARRAVPHALAADRRPRRARRARQPRHGPDLRAAAPAVGNARRPAARREPPVPALFVPLSAMPPQDLAWIAPAFAVFWLVLTGALSHLSGWHELAKRFRSDDSIEGRRFRFRSAAIGWPYFPVSYGGSLFATVGSRGFTLS